MILNHSRILSISRYVFIPLVVWLLVFGYLKTWQTDFVKQKKAQKLLKSRMAGLADHFAFQNLSEIRRQSFLTRLNLTNPGDMGEPVVLPKSLPDDIKKLVDEGWRDYTINKFVSDLVPVRRTLPDIRGDYCKAQVYENLPKASVVIIFHNEAFSMVSWTLEFFICF